MEPLQALGPLAYKAPVAPVSAIDTEVAQQARAAQEARVEKARETREAFSQFVGETFYMSLLKQMRKSVGEPAYFHGGQAEELFQARLDQQRATDMASTSGDTFSEQLFKNQFPEEAALLREAEGPLAELNQLRRR